MLVNELQIIGEIVDQLRSSVVLYEELFNSQQNSDFISYYPIPSQPFQIIQGALQYEIVMRISSLMDPAQMGKNDNLTFQRVYGLLKSSIKQVESETKSGRFTHEELGLKIEMFEQVKMDLSILETLYDETGLRDYRNKLGAHLDLKQSTGVTKPLNIVIDYEKLSEILNKMICIIHLAGEIYEGEGKDQLIYRNRDMPKSAGGKSLMKALDEHKKAYDATNKENKK
ncbi:hypothetical protein D5018_19575 [Parashewanella curva]|uniref:HEPN AbiU2-like domain-containing protein n=1 Tax=Parashewanella curva TaxID=2338552 RepID=A0A3L8PTS8_9GAMM|nr:hypothetical protein [Parashewanella curva]RLV58003.1 hypothetical protein D5018_19575 [Parashewanella curva]